MRRWPSLLVAVSLVGIFALVGCGGGGGDDDHTPTPTPTPTATPTPTPSPSPTPITPDPTVVASLKITPGQTFKVGETKNITFVAQNAADAPVAASPTFTLVTGNALQVPANGNATGVNAEGTAVVSAAVGAITDTATITVLPADEITTASGLKYQEFRIQPGAEAAAPGKTATVNYILKLTDGTQLQASSFSFKLGTTPLQVIKGFDEGVQRMSVGTKSRFTLPPNLAYGDHPPAGSGIPVNATLIFEVELTKLQ